MIDSRVVDLKFNWSQFADGVRGVLSGVAQLTKGLQLTGASKGMVDVSKTAQQVPTSLNAIGTAATGISGRISAMSIIAVGALLQIGSTAVQQGAQMAKAFTIGPIMEGFREYETKLGSIQTILANTKASGATLADVSGTLKELNTYSDQTIYNFGEMAKNIGTFTAAGVGLETATSSIKGIANLAALSGSNSQQASTAMYQLSQAISSGRVSLMDWNSVVNAGMGGTVFQRALAETAVAMGKIPAEAVKLEGAMKNVKIEGKSFRDSISAEGGPSWLTSDVLTTALGNFTGDMKEADLVAQGFSKNQAKAIMDTAKTAKEAATVVKTGSQLVGTLKEAAASGWSETFELIIGDFEQAKTLWTGANNVFGGMIQVSADARNKVLSDWNALGGRDVLIKGIKNAFAGLMGVLKPIKEAFREIFPAKTGQDLFNLTADFTAFTTKLKMGEETANNVKRTFAGVFAIFSIIGQILGGAAGMVAKFFGAVSSGSGGFLNFTGGIGDFLVSLDQMLEKSGLITTFFNGLGKIIALPVAALGKLAGFLGNLFSGFDAGGVAKVTGALDAVGQRMSPLQAIGERLRGMFSTLGGMIKSAMRQVGEAMSSVGDVIGDAFASANYSKVLDTLNTGLFAVIILAIKKFMAGGITIDAGTGGLFDSVRGALDGVTETLGNMQANLKSDILLKIAAALALLTVSIVALSLIDSGALTKALVALSTGFILMSAGLSNLAGSTSLLGSIKMLPIAASLLVLGGALILMAGAMKIMSTMSWNEIGKGLVGIGASLVVIAAAMRLMPSNMVLQAVAIGILGASLMVLAGAVKLFSTIDMGILGQGLAGIGASLVVLAFGMRLMPQNMLLQAVALGVLAVSLSAMAGAVALFAAMSLGTIAQGLGSIAAALVILAFGMALMPKNMLLQAAALVAVGAALNLIALAVGQMGGMDMAEIGKGLLVLGGAMLILAVGLNAMTGAVAGAIALGIATAALMLLTPVLITLGSLSWETIVKGLATLAGVFVTFGVAALLLAPVAPVLLALGAAILMMGIGVAAAGVGILALAKAFDIFASTVGSIIMGIIGFFVKLGSSIGPAVIAIGRGVDNAARSVGQTVGKFVSAAGSIIAGIVSTVAKGVVTVAQRFGQMVTNGVARLRAGIGSFVSAGVSLVTTLISNMTARMAGIAAVAAAGISRLASSLRAGVSAIVGAATSLVSGFINTVRSGLSSGASSLASSAGNIGRQIVSGMARGISKGLSIVTNAARNLASSALSAAKGVLGIKSPSKEFEKIGKFAVEGFGKGLTGDQAKIKEAYKSMGDQLIEGMRNTDARIKSEQDKLDKLRGSSALKVRSAQENLAKLQSAKKKDAAAIAKAQRAVREATAKDTMAIKETAAALAQAKKERAAYGAGLTELHKKLNDEEIKLESLSIQRNRLTEEIKEQTKAVEDAIKTRDDFAKSTTDQFRNLPDVSKDTKLPKYIEELSKKVVETQNFSTAIQKLRDLGLNDTMYKELLAKGIEANPFLVQLLDSGKGGVEAINKLGSQLDLASSKIGTSASVALYQAGVDAAQGLLKGLQSKESAIAKQMEALAATMVNALKKKLGIKSPSREFAKLGVYSAQGLAKGFASSSAVGDAADAVGNEALEAVRRAMSSMGDIVAGDMNLNPVITPVLDLSSVRKDAATLSGLTTTAPISVGASYSKAKSAFKGYENSQMVSEAAPPVVIKETTLNYTQNNTSPKALSDATIYRGTKNQLSTVKRGLKT